MAALKGVQASVSNHLSIGQDGNAYPNPQAIFLHAAIVQTSRGAFRDTAVMGKSS